jgi:hypothetical protein
MLARKYFTALVLRTKLDFIQCERMTRQGKLRQLSTKRIADADPAQRLS